MEKLDVNAINDNSMELSDKYIKSIKINDSSVQALIDPGSAVCTITATTVLREGFAVERRPSELRGFGSNIVTSIGIVKAIVDVDGVTVDDIVLRVVPDNVQTWNVIIGRTFTEQPEIAYFKIDNHLIF